MALRLLRFSAKVFVRGVALPWWLQKSQNRPLHLAHGDELIRLLAFASAGSNVSDRGEHQRLQSIAREIREGDSGQRVHRYMFKWHFRSLDESFS